ncbi:MAG TPA: hypothetical protein PLG50_11990, partial [bacterium]|nr:hypothetical protein [bacterium]
ASIRDPRAYTVVAYWEGIDSGTGDPSNAVTFTYEIASPDPPVITTPATGTTITSALGTSYTTVTVSGTYTPLTNAFIPGLIGPIALSRSTTMHWEG